MKYYDIRIIIILLLSCAALWWLAGHAEKVKNSKWRLCYLLPMFIIMAVTLKAGPDICMTPAYLAAAGLTAGLVWDDRKSRRITTAVCAALALTAIPVCKFSGYYCQTDYLEKFENTFEDMKAHYALSDHKQTDWDALHAKYVPLFRKAAADDDREEDFNAWMRFAAEFDDDHVYYIPVLEYNSISQFAVYDNDLITSCSKKNSGADHGLAVMKMSDGSFAAVDVDPSVRGIHNGTRIISWNGLSPDEAEKSCPMYDMVSYGDIDNELFYQGLYAAGQGDTAEVVYIDDDGNEQTAELPHIGSISYYDRLSETLDKLDRGVDDIGHMQWKKVSDDTGLIRVKVMAFDTSQVYVLMHKQVMEIVDEMKEQGVKNVIIDLRNNGGGDAQMARAIAAIFAPKGDHFFACNPLWDEENGTYARDENGRFIKDLEVRYEGEDAMNGGQIVLLVNSHSASAADHVVKTMRGFDNVTVMGFTESAGVGQGTHINVISEHTGILSWSQTVLLDEDGNIFIDAGTDRQSANGLDVRIPLDDRAVEAVFDRDEDYVLECALEYIEKNQ